MRLLLITICSVIIQSACAQLQLVPIPHWSAQGNVASDRLERSDASPAARTKATLSIPFWDDFSDANTSTPSSDLWFAGNSIWINDGLGINPPSLNVASFDGVDSLGKPYSVNDVLAKGYADKLESFPIDLLAIAEAERTSVYLSFYYQMKGRGELPDAGDRLVLEFRNAEDKWKEVWAVENDGTQVGDVFNQVVLPVTATEFYHEDFRFRFKNFARLSGPYDTWHVDYIYLNKGRAADDVSYPDRSIVSPLTSVFKVYHAIPKDHFFVDKEATMAKPTIVVTNLLEGNIQPLNYFSYAQIEQYDGATPILQPVTLMDSATSIGAVNTLEYKTAEVNTDNLSDLLDESFDSLHISLKVGLSTKDNVLPADDGDYDLKYAPIDFRLNDTTRAEYWLSSYYAYDDGAAEYGAALNQPGAQVAYEYNLVGVDSGFVNFLQLYFPRFGDETSQVIELRIWKDLLELETSLLYSEVVTLQRTDDNLFWLKKLARSVEVPPRFYIGWRQSSSAIIAVGFDKNTSSGDKISFNINGTWEDNTLLTGSLMMRPVFGPGPDDPGGPITSIKESYADEGRSPFPNPSSGAFIIPGHVNNVTMVDLSGRWVAVDVVEGFEETQVTLSNPSPGLYVVRYLRDGFPKAVKIMVR